MVTSENSFSPTDLIRYVEYLLKESFQERSSYTWLKSRHIQPEVAQTHKELQKLRPMILKMTSENCAKIAVTLDSLADGLSAAAILTTLKKLIQEQYSIQILQYNVKCAKERRRNRINRVHPELMPDGRLPTVSFILQL